MITKLLKLLVLLIPMLCVSCAAQLPQAAVTIKATNEDGQPVSGATAGASFNDPTSKTLVNFVEGQTDNAGQFMAVARTDGLMSYSVTKDGYYKSVGRNGFFTIDGNHWQPWNPTLELVLKKVVNPVPMYARRLDIPIPVDNKTIGFDLIESDWVAPFGKGKTSDFVFLLERKLIDLTNYDVKLTLTFSNTGDGIQTINAPRKQGSELRLPREAPAENYSDKWIAAIGLNQNKPIYDKPQPDRCFFFRVRTVLKDGAVKQAMYGKISGDIKIVSYASEHVSIRINYYLNPDGTRNMEFDPKRNILINLRGREQVREP
jgi:hypothetical protein